MQFLEDKDGCVITPTQASLICDQACSIWNQISASNMSLLPTSWGQAGLNHQLFNKQMHAEFKEFQYCKANWKSKAFATEYYSSWYRKHANGCKVKSEDSGVCPDATGIKSRKQPLICKLNPAGKKAKPTTTTKWLSSTPVNLSSDSSHISAQSTPLPKLVAAQIDTLDTLSDIAKGKQHVEFKVPHPL